MKTPFSRSLCAALLFTAPITLPALAQTAAKSGEYTDFNPGNNSGADQWVQSIVITAPELRSHVKGDVEVKFNAPGMTAARALCWQQPTAGNSDPAGHDTVVGSEITLDAQGAGSFTFPADKYPNGPITIRILANNADNTQKDIRELQLYNDGGVPFNQGIPQDRSSGGHRHEARLLRRLRQAAVDLARWPECHLCLAQAGRWRF